jgi:hypothetical protein
VRGRPSTASEREYQRGFNSVDSLTSGDTL